MRSRPRAVSSRQARRSSTWSISTRRRTVRTPITAWSSRSSARPARRSSSAAVRHPEFVAQAGKKYGNKIVVGIDAKSETVRTDGWLDDSGENYIAFAERMESYGVKNIIFTDIDKDGMLAGPNFDQLAALRASVSCEIIASGGVSTLEDIAALKKLGIDGAIAGKAVYTGTLDLAKAIKEAE